MASALNDAKSAWDECLHKNCKKCLDQYNGRKFAAVRRTIVNGSERTAKLGQEIFFPRLDDLKKLNSLFDVPMVDYKHIPPHMTAVWTVTDDKFVSVPIAGTSVRLTSRTRPKIAEELTIVITGVSHCICILQQFAKAGKLNGPMEVRVDALEVSSSTEYSTVVDDKSYHKGLKNKLVKALPGTVEYMLSGTDDEDDEEGEVDFASPPSGGRKRAHTAAEKVKIQKLHKLARKTMNNDKTQSTSKVPPSNRQQLISTEESSSESDGNISDGYGDGQEKQPPKMTVRSMKRSSNQKRKGSSNTPSAGKKPVISSEESSSESEEDTYNDLTGNPIDASTPKGNGRRPDSETSREPFPNSETSPAPPAKRKPLMKTNVCRRLDGGVLTDHSESPELNLVNSSGGDEFHSVGRFDHSLVADDVGPTIMPFEGEMPSLATGETSKFSRTEPLWQSIELPLKQEFQHDLEKLQRVKTSILRIGTKSNVKIVPYNNVTQVITNLYAAEHELVGEVNAMIGKEGLELMETLMQRMNGRGVPLDVIQLLKQASSKIGDFVENSLHQQETLEDEVVGAYRCAAAHAIESMASKRTVIICRKLMSSGGSCENFSQADWDTIGNPEEPDFIENFALAYKYLLSPEVREGIGGSESEILDSAQKASRAKISERVVFPKGLVLLADNYKGPHGHEVADHDTIMTNDPKKIVFHYRHYDKMQKRWYRPVTQQAWIRENDFSRLQDEFNGMSFIDPKDPRFKFPEAQYTRFNSFIQIFIQTFMRNPAVQYNFWTTCMNPLAQVMVQILTGLLRFFGVRDNERRKMRKEPTYEYYEAAIRAAVTKLNKVCSDSRRRALGGNEQIAIVNEKDCDTSEFAKGCPVGKVKARRRYDPSVPNQLNLVEFCDDSLNEENSFIKCFWKQAPESYMDLTLSASRRQQQIVRTPVPLTELERCLKEKLSPQEVEGPRPKIFSTTPTNDKESLVAVDPTTGVRGSIRYISPRKLNRRRKIKASLTNIEKGEKIVHQLQNSTAGKENDFIFKIGANVYKNKTSASEAIRSVLIQTNENISKTEVANGIKKVLRGKITLNELASSIERS